MIITKKELLKLKSNKINEQERRIIVRKIQKRNEIITDIILFLLIELCFIACGFYWLNGYNF